MPKSCKLRYWPAHSPRLDDVDGAPDGRRRGLAHLHPFLPLPLLLLLVAHEPTASARGRRVDSAGNHPGRSWRPGLRVCPKIAFPLPTRPAASYGVVVSLRPSSPRPLLAGLLLALATTTAAGCDGLACRREFPVGSCLYRRDDPAHILYGRVSAQDFRHDFRNGLGAQPSVEIILDDGSSQRVWAACEVVRGSYEVRGP